MNRRNFLASLAAFPLAAKSLPRVLAEEPVRVPVAGAQIFKGDLVYLDAGHWFPLRVDPPSQQWIDFDRRIATDAARAMRWRTEMAPGEE